MEGCGHRRNGYRSRKKMTKDFESVSSWQYIFPLRNESKHMLPLPQAELIVFYFRILCKMLLFNLFFVCFRLKIENSKEEKLQFQLIWAVCQCECGDEPKKGGNGVACVFHCLTELFTCSQCSQLWRLCVFCDTVWRSMAVWCGGTCRSTVVIKKL